VASPLDGRDDFQLKHSWPAVPQGWEVHSAPPPDHLINLRIGLKASYKLAITIVRAGIEFYFQQEGKIDELINHLYEVSDPNHHRYGKHLSKEEVDALVEPHPDTVAAVEDWLRSHDIEPSGCDRTTGGDWLHVPVPVSKAESMFNTKYQVYRHKETGEYTVRSLSWSLPRKVHSHIDVIEPTTMFGRLRKMKATSFLMPDQKVGSQEDTDVTPSAVPPTSCNTVITPSCLRTLYNTINYKPAATTKNAIGVAGYLGEFANDADLAVRIFLCFLNPLS